MQTQNNKISLGRMVLRSEILDLIKADQELNGKVAKELGVSVLSLPRILKDIDPRLTQYAVLKVIADHLSKKDIEDLLEPELQAEDKTNS